jgi:hypothetical protein
MGPQSLSRLKSWTRNGAIFGVLMLILDLTGWRGQTFVPWDAPNGVATNVGYIVGGIVGGAFIFLLAAVVVNLFVRD